MSLDKLISILAKYVKYREGLLIYITVNIYLLTTIPLSWLYYDVRYYYEWVDIAWNHGFVYSIVRIPGVGCIPILFPRGVLYIYVYATKASYPPLPILLFILTHSLATSLTSSIQFIRFINKLPLVIVFNITYFILKKNYGWKAGLLWAINGFTYLVVYNLHTDLFVSLFLLLSFLEFCRRDSVVKSSIYLALASLFKPVVVFTGLIQLLTLWKNRRFREAVLFITSGLLTCLLVSLPFLLIDYRSFIYKAVFFHVDRFPQEYSLWAVPIYLYNYDVSKIPVFIKYLWSPVFILSLVFIYYKLFREKELSEINIVKYYLLVLLTMYIVNKIGNINYFVWCIPFLTIYIVEKKLYHCAKFTVLYIFIPLAMVFIAPLTTFYAAFIVQGSVFIIEDLSYYSATELTIKSIDPITIQVVLAEYLRTHAYWYFLMLYMGINVSYIFFSILYNGYLIYLLYKVVSSGR